MSLVKQSQSAHLDGVMVRPEDLPKLLDDVGDLRFDLSIEPEGKEEEELLSDGGEAKGEVTIEVGDEDPIHEEFSFKLPAVPGGDDQEEIEEPADLEVAEDDDQVEVVSDPNKWTVDTFMEYLRNKWTNLPRHSGRDTTGLERVIAVLEALDREISKAVRMDTDGKLDIGVLEGIRDEIHDGIKRSKERLDKIQTTKYPSKIKKKKADVDGESELVKEAQKATHVGGIMITVPLLISSLARSCINGMVSAGHDIEDIFRKVSKEYDLSKREKLELIQLLSDMNYPVRRDLGMPLDKEIDTTSSDNVNWSAQYNA